MRNLSVLIGSIVVVLALFAVAPNSRGSPRSSSTAHTTGTVPSRLVGKWGHKITLADWKRAGVSNPASYPTGSWGLEISKKGALDVYLPNGTYEFTTHVAVSGAQLTGGVYHNCPAKGRYRWTLAGKTLTVKKVADSCPERVGLFAGAWKKK